MKISIKDTLKHVLFHMAPELAGTLQIIWQRKHNEDFERRLGLPRIGSAFIAHHGLNVLDGPFRGMTYVPKAAGSSLVPKLLGCYEAELHGVLARILAKEYKLVIDIGCAEGYYAVGLALHLSSTHIYAFDIDPLARRLCRTMAHVNHVSDHVTIASKCNPESLDSLLTSQGALVICDCEGHEIDLLCPNLVPGIKSADILVELHDFGNSSAISQAIIQRFNATHDIMLMTSAARDPTAYAALDFLAQTDRHLAVSEFRPAEQQWAFMTPKPR